MSAAAIRGAFACFCAFALALSSAPSVPSAATQYAYLQAVGDFNGDGRPDLAVAFQGQRSLSLRLNQGAGRLVEQPPAPLVAEPLSLGAGDLNGDGLADMVVGLPGTLLVLFSEGSGNLRLAGEYAAGPQSSAIALGDFNGDGRTDVVVADWTARSLSVRLGNGDGSLQPAVSTPVDPTPAALAAADFDGDGRADLAVAHAWTYEVSLLAGQGDGTFRMAGHFSVGQVPGALAAADFDGDRKPDLAVANLADGTVSWLAGNGDGTFHAWRERKFAPGAVLASMVGADFDGDGQAELAFPGPRAAGAPQGFEAITATTLGASPNPSVFGAQVTLMVTVFPAAATGKVTFYDGTTVLGVRTLASGTATFQTTLLPAGIRSLRAYYGGDASYLPSTSSSLALTVNAQPANGFQAAVNYAAGTHPSSVAVGDFNGDGKADLAVANGASDNVRLLLGQGNGTFPSAVDHAVGNHPVSVAVGDFNEDGLADLVVANVGGLYAGCVSVLLSAGGGKFYPAVNYAAGTHPSSVAVGDFNADGKADLAAGDSGSSNVSVLQGQGNGTFQPAVNYAAGTHPSSVAVGEFNGDGKADLAVANSDSNDVSVLQGQGNGTFQAAVNYAAGTYAHSVAIGDFNADGKADLAVANYGSSNVSVLLGQGNGTFQAAVNYAAGSWPYSVAVGDFNGDGKADLAVANQVSHDVSLLLGNGNGTFQPAVNYAAGAGPASLAVGDFNGDGRADLAVANAQSGNVSILLGAGAAAPTVGVVSPSAGSGVIQTFTFTFSDPNGWQDLGVVNVLVNFWLDGRYSCYLAYSRPLSVLYLVNDAGTALSPALTLGSAGGLSNSQCSIYGTGSSATGSGTTLTLTLNMSFNSGYAGAKILYMAARDVAENNSGWQRKGVWIVPGAPATSPAVVGMAPHSGSGAGPATFSFQFSDNDGYTDLGVLNILVNDWLDGRNACYIAYSRTYGVLYLVNDAGTALSPGLTLGSGASVSNSQCTVYGPGSSATGSGTTLTLTLTMSFKPAFAGNRVFYLAARDAAEHNSGWQAMGTWTVP